MKIASIAGSGIKSLFTGIDSHDTAVLAFSSTHRIYSFMSFFYLFIYFFVIANIFFSNRSLGTFFHGFCIPFPFLFPFPDSGFRVLVLPIFYTFVSLSFYLIAGSWHKKISCDFFARSAALQP